MDLHKARDQAALDAGIMEKCPAGAQAAHGQLKLM